MDTLTISCFSAGLFIPVFGGTMPNMTLAIPEDLKKKMDEHPEFNWSAIARQAFIRNISDLEAIRDFKKDLDFTEEDAVKFGREVKKRMAIRRGLYKKFGDRRKHSLRNSSNKRKN